VLVGEGLSRLLVDYAPKADWQLITAEYCLSEVEKNVGKHAAGAVEWRRLVQPRLTAVGSVYVFDRPIVFDATKDRPVLLSAIGGNAEYLVTLDTTDFAHVLGSVVYGVEVRTPENVFPGDGNPQVTRAKQCLPRTQGAVRRRAS
jgi:hypothetical protein